MLETKIVSAYTRKVFERDKIAIVNHFNPYATGSDIKIENMHVSMYV